MSGTTDLERLVVQLNADVRGFRKELQRGRLEARKNARMIAGEFQDMNRKIESGTEGAARAVRRAIAGIGVAYVARETQQLADAWTNAENQLRSTSAAIGRPVASLDDLADAARDTRSELDATVSLYARLERAAEPLALSQERILRVTELVNKAFVAGGAAASERRAALTQLSQGIASGYLQGDELRSIRENAPVIAQAIADEFGVTIGGLKDLGAEGELTADRIINAITSAATEIEAQFSQTEATVGDSFTRLRTEAARFVGQVDEATGATRTLGDFIEFAADNLDLFGDVAVAAAMAVGGVLAAQAVRSAVAAITAMGLAAGGASGQLARMAAASIVAARAAQTLSAALSFAGGPIGVAIMAITAAVYGLYVVTRNAARQAREELAEFQRESEEARSTLQRLGEYGQGAAGSIDAVGDAARTQMPQVEAFAGQVGDLAQELFELGRARKQNALDDAVVGQIRTLQRIAQLEAEIGEQRRRRQAVDAITSVRRDAPMRAPRAPSAQETALVGQLERAREELERFETEADRLLGLTYEDFVRPSDIPQKTDEELEREAVEARRRRERRQDIALENALAKARAQGAEAEEQVAERAIALQRRIRDYEAAGIENAEAQAIADQHALNLAEDRAAAAAREIEKREEIASLAEAALEHEYELARARGDERRINALERELEIRRRIAEYVDRDGLAAEEAVDRASRDVAELEAARAYGEARDSAARAFSDAAVTALKDGDVGAAFGRVIADVGVKAFGDIMYDVGAHIFDQLSSAGQALNFSVSIASGGSTAAAAMGGALTAAGATTATTIATAFTAAGQVVAAQIAAAMAAGQAVSGAQSAIGTVLGFGGARAEGGPTWPGKYYTVGEKGKTELFSPGVAGAISPLQAVSPASASMGSGRGGALSLTLNLNASGSVGVEGVRAIVDQSLEAAAPALLQAADELRAARAFAQG